MDEAIRFATIIAAARRVMLVSGLFMALVPMSAQSAGILQEKPTMIKPTIVVEHIRIESSKSFADVAASRIGFSHRSRRLVKVFRIELAVTGAKSMTS